VRRRLGAVIALFKAMQSSLDLGRALLRARYMCAVARIEANGVPIDGDILSLMVAGWPGIREGVVRQIDRGYGVYDRNRFRPDLFEAWIEQQDIPWPRNSRGRLDLGDETFRDLARAYPEIRSLKELRALLTGFDPTQLAVGRDNRNRLPLRPFSSRTGRNEPGAKASVFGSAAWVRHLVRPEPGKGLALIDWSQQEFGIAAALSGDTAMMEAYASGDPYLALAITAGAAPTGANSQTQADVRERFKACALGIQNGMGAVTLARLTGLSEIEARQLQHWHQTAYREFWRWSDAIEVEGTLGGSLTSVFGWRIAIGSDANPRFLRNFPVQANGAEMLRLACCLATEAGIRVCMPMHDALLIESRLDDLEETVMATKSFMAQASATVLDGFDLRTKVKLVRWPDRYSDPRGAAVWNAVEKVLSDA
jgi:hypothetical protein